MSVGRILKHSLFTFSLLCVAAAHASTVPTFDTLGPNNAYTFQQGWAIGGGTVSTFNYAPAMQFTATVGGVLFSAELVAQTSCCAGASPNVTLVLYSDKQGRPDQVLDTAGTSVSYTAQVDSGTFSEGLQIVSGMTYWFGVRTADSNAGHNWANNVLGFAGTMAGSGAAWQQPGEWFLNQGVTLAAFRVSVTSPVDEPAAALLLALGVLPLAYRLRHRI